MIPEDWIKIFDTSYDPIIVCKVPENIQCTGDLKIIYVNSFTSSSLGFDATKCVGKTFREEFPDFIDTAAGKMYMTSIEKNTHIDIGTFPFGDNRINPKYFTVSVLPISNFFIIRYKVVGEKTERKETDNFYLSLLTHELRNAANGVKGILDLCRYETTEDKLRNYIKMANSCSDSLVSLLEDLLDVTAIDEGRFVLEVTQFDLYELIYTIGLPYEKNENNVKYIINYGPSIPRKVFGDVVRIRQILKNLVSNAFKFTKKGFVEVIVEKTGSNNVIDISVIDTGKGIGEDQLLTLLKKIQSPENGRGLGLWITNKIVKKIGGYLACESKVDCGTKFIVKSLPLLSKSDDIFKKDIKPINEKYDLNLLIVDDVNHNLVLFESVLSFYKCTLITAENGQLAVDLFKKHYKDIDGIFMDLKMPVKNGLIATKEIRDFERLYNLPTTPVIGCSASIYDKDVFSSSGIDYFIRKPISVEDIGKQLKFITNYKNN